MSKIGKFKINKIIRVMVLLMVLIIVSGAVAYLIKGRQTPINIDTFYIKQGDVTYYDGTYNLNTEIGEEVKFDVFYSVDKKGNPTSSDYVLSVIPSGEDFYYKVDGAYKNFLALDNLEKVFKINQYEGYFTLEFEKYTVLDILKKCYPDNVVEIDLDMTATSYFLLIIKTPDDKNSISFNLPYYPNCIDVTLSESEVVF